MVPGGNTRFCTLPSYQLVMFIRENFESLWHQLFLAILEMLLFHFTFFFFLETLLFHPLTTSLFLLESKPKHHSKSKHQRKAVSKNLHLPNGALQLLGSLAGPLGLMSCGRSGELGQKGPSDLNSSSCSSTQDWGSFTLFPHDVSITVTCICT